MNARRKSWHYRAGLRLLLVVGAAGLAMPNAAQSQSADRAPNWPTSPYHGVIDGNGEIIPCRCRFGGHFYALGEQVCMETPVGTVLTRCDLILNNTSWVPTSTPCRISSRLPSYALAASGR